jgi:hypothetical protein
LAKAAPGPIALRAALEAEMNVGVREVGNNGGKWVALYLKAVNLLIGNPWCLAFLVFRLLDAASDLKKKLPSDVPRTGYTPTFANWAKQNGLWTPVSAARLYYGHVQRGDFAFFYRSAMGRISHVGVVLEVHSWGVVTVEGNTNQAGSREGDGVYKKSRTWADLGAKGGFVRLPF